MVSVESGFVSTGVVDPVGSVVATSSLFVGEGDDVASGGVVWSGLSLFDEYGNPVSAHVTDTGVVGYGWLGGKERAFDVSGLVLMGVRLYNAVTGHFTSVDPVVGGNTTRYSYPQDPINQYDLDGNAWGWAKSVGKWAWKNKWDIALTAASFVPGLGAAAWGVRIAKVVKSASVAKKIASGRKPLGMAQKIFNTKKSPTYRASRPTVAVAGRIWAGRGATWQRSASGTKMLVGKSGNVYRPAAKKGRGWTSNLDYGTDRSVHTYSSLHINHSKRYW